MSDMVSVSGLNKSFGSLHVLKDVSLQVAPGTTTAIIGPSGSGKSTLLRCLNLLEYPDSGTVAVGGDAIDFTPGHKPKNAEIAAIRRRTSMVFQAFHLFPHLTIMQNVIEAPVRVLKENPVAAKADAAALLAKVGLAEKADAYPGTLSGGQQQRAAIARALAVKPEVLLFDEPTSALDPELEREVLKVIKDLVAERRTMILVTHNLNFARDVADTIVFMEDGRIVDAGPPEYMFSDRAAARVQSFISAMQGD